MKKFVSNFISIFLIMSLLLLIVQQTTYFNNNLRYYDEFYSFLFFPFLIAYFVEKVRLKEENSISKEVWGISVLIILFLLVGFIGNLINNYQDIKYAIVDSYLNVKFFLALGTTYLLGRKIENFGFLKKSLSWILKSVSILFLILTIVEYIHPIFNLTTEIRYGIKCTKLFFNHSTYYSAALSTIGLGIILFTNKKTDYLYAVICFLLAVLTLRTKTIVFVAMCGVVAVIFKLKKIQTKYKVFAVSAALVLLAIGTIFGYNTFKFYFLDIDNSARNVLSKTSVKISKTLFPLGSGFGSFASAISGSHYSTIYKEYGIDQIVGLVEGDAEYVSDSFWPMILGQTGILGLLIYISIMSLMILQIKKKTNEKYLYVAAVSFIYLFISSTSESAFVNPIAIGFAIIIILCVFKDKLEEVGAIDNSIKGAQEGLK